MPFQSGSSGNPKGRPKQTDAQKEQSKIFKEMLKQATVPALQGIKDIAFDKHNKDRFNACRFIIEKAYGSNTQLLVDDDMETLTIKIITRDPQAERDADIDDDWVD